MSTLHIVCVAVRNTAAEFICDMCIRTLAVFGHAWYVVCFVISLHIFVDDNFFLYAINTYDNSIVNTQYYLKGMNFVVGYCYVWRRRDKHRTTKLNKFQIFSWRCISTFFSTKSVKKTGDHAVEMCRYSIWRDEFILLFKLCWTSKQLMNDELPQIDHPNSVLDTNFFPPWYKKPFTDTKNPGYNHTKTSDESSWHVATQQHSHKVLTYLWYQNYTFHSLIFLVTRWIGIPGANLKILHSAQL